MTSERQRIGIFGGSFDPIHQGHLLIAEWIRDELNFQKVIFVPTHIHPLKHNASATPAHHRLEMVKLAIANNQFFEVSDIEIRKESVSYTIDTLKAFRQIYPPDQYQLYFLIGQDNLNQLHLWKDPIKLVQMAQFVAFGRPGFEPSPEAQPFLPFIQFIEIPLLEISATRVRERLRTGKTVRYMVPDAVIEYIHTHQLYRTPAR